MDHPLAPSATTGTFAHAGPFFDLGVLLHLRHDTTRPYQSTLDRCRAIAQRPHLDRTNASESQSRSEKTSGGTRSALVVIGAHLN